MATQEQMKPLSLLQWMAANMAPSDRFEVLVDVPELPIKQAAQDHPDRPTACQRQPSARFG
jgi:hypothetical protein